MAGEEQRPVPPALPTVEQVPEELRNLKRWVGWRAAWDASKEKWRKPPHSPVTGEAIGAVDKWAEHWLTFDAAITGVKEHQLDGVGFVFKEGDGYVGIDFDDCRTTDGIIHAEVLSWLRWLPTYQEVSPSGGGVHAIARGRIPKAMTATPLPGAGDSKVEMYFTGRYFTFTGHHVGNHPNVFDCQVGIEKLQVHLGKHGAPNTESDEGRPLSKLSARKIHKDNLDALRRAAQGEGNALLNQAAFFAGRAFTAGVLEGTEESIKQELLDIVTREWRSPHPEHGARQTIGSGWDSGVSKPLKIAEDEFPQIAETMEELKKFFFVNNFGLKNRVCFIKEISDTKGKGKMYLLIAQSIPDFKGRYQDQLIVTGVKEDGEPRLEDKATVWLRNPNKRRFEQVVFKPQEKTPPDEYNLWRGFAYEPKKGDCSLYLNHVRDNICRGDKVKYAYLIGWMAYAVRHPNEQGHVAIVVQGLKGVGKNVFAENFSALFGQHQIVVSDQSRITRNFNAHLRDKCALVADEAFFAGDRRHEGVLKALITGNTITIEAKGIDAETVPNLLHVIIIGNDRWLVPASAEERRYLVLNCSDAKKTNHRYFQAINDQLNHRGGYEALLYHLLNEVDLSKFNVREAPHTDELREQMIESLRDEDAAWYECLYNGLIPARVLNDGTCELCGADFINWARSKQQRWGNIKPQHVGLLFGQTRVGHQQGFNFQRARNLIHGKQLRYWTIPPLGVARKMWDDLRQKVEWPQDGNEWDTIEGQDIKF